MTRRTLLEARDALIESIDRARLDGEGELIVALAHALAEVAQAVMEAE